MGSEISIAAIHPWMEDKNGIVKHLHIKDKEIINSMKVDKENPEYVIASEHIYKNPSLFRYFKELAANQNRIFIFYGGEAVFPDLNIFDYAISFSRSIVDNKRISRIPLFIFFENTMIKGITHNSLSFDDAKKELKENKRKFCNFMYSNPHAHPMRDQLFWEISKYKRVDSTGQHLNNTEVSPTRGEKNWAEISVDVKKKYKFVITSENAKFEGYTSEKVITSLQAHSIPIYWGNPDIIMDINSDAIINANDYSSFDDLIEYIKSIDEDDNKWAEIVSSPWQTKEQVERMKIEEGNYQSFLKNIFDSHRKIVPSGSFIDIYDDWFYRPYRSDSILKKISRRIKLT